MAGMRLLWKNNTHLDLEDICQAPVLLSSWIIMKNKSCQENNKVFHWSEGAARALTKLGKPSYTWPETAIPNCGILCGSNELPQFTPF